MGDAARAIQVQQVDERDSGWKDSTPRFRVYLHGSCQASTHRWTDTYDITGADVLQVIDWAQRQAGDQLAYAVALVRGDAERERVNSGFGRGSVWLVGMDGNDSSNEGSTERDVQQRMLRRRQTSLGVRKATERSVPFWTPIPTVGGQRKAGVLISADPHPFNGISEGSLLIRSPLN